MAPLVMTHMVKTLSYVTTGQVRMTYTTNKREPAIDENRFLQDVDPHICGSLEIGKGTS